jgi:Asp-tRNA(Asn)/Glu-tRNA(Gln) amidotransferase A subunit family amidase
MSEELCYLPAAEAVGLFRARALSPVELVRALVARCEAVEPRVRAFTHTYFDRALAAARQAEARYARGEARALEGVPLAVKDLHPVQGEVTTHGSLVFANNRDETTLATVRRLLDAGAILFARSASSEFGNATVTRSRLWGTSHNPWNLAYNPGGSSGGAGAALAAGTVTLADGSDYGGSIRIPASCCGVLGYKPPHGRNPGDPGASLDPFSHFGPLARSVADLALMQNVMSGPLETDLGSLPERVTLPTRFDGVRGWRVAWSLDLGYFRVDPDVRANTLAALDALRGEGCDVDAEPTELGWTDAVREAFERHHDAVEAATLWPLLPTRRDDLTDYALESIEGGTAVTVREFLATNEVRVEMYKTLGPVLGRRDLFVCPTTALPSVPAEHSPLAHDFAIDGRPASARIGWVMTYPFNMLGPLPVLSYPSGRSRDGVPTGVQLVARPHDDLRVFRAAAALERALGPWYRAPESRPRL